MAADQTFPLNPWLSIWTQPRRTMRQILDSDPERNIYVLATIAGVSRVLDRASLRSMGDEVPIFVILGLALIAGTVGGVIMIYLYGSLLRWTGKWFGGSGTNIEVRAAFAWPNAILAWALLLWIPELLIFGEELFTSETPRLDASMTLTLLYLGFLFLELVIGVWCAVAFLKCLGEAQGFSAWRALANSIVALLVLVVPVLLFVVIGLMVS